MDGLKVLVFISFCVLPCRSQVVNPMIFQTCVPLDSCAGLPTGAYPSCTSCSKFVLCTSGMYRTLQCPAPLMYNPTTGMCDTSGTCNLATLVTANTPNPNPSVTHQDKTTSSSTSTTSTSTTTTTTTTTTPKTQKKVITIKGRGFTKTITFETGCVKNCYGQPYGYFPSCYGCSKVVICKPYWKRIGRCYYGNQWDDRTCRCQHQSSTCSESVRRTPRRYYSYGWK